MVGVSASFVHILFFKMSTCAASGRLGQFREMTFQALNHFVQYSGGLSDQKTRQIRNYLLFLQVTFFANGVELAMGCFSQGIFEPIVNNSWLVYGPIGYNGNRMVM